MGGLLARARRIASAAWRHRWASLALAWLACLAGWAGVQALPDQYRASARVYADADAVLGPLLRGLAAEGAPGRQIETLQRTLLSRPNLERVAGRTGLDLRDGGGGPAGRERLLARLGAEIRLASQTRNLFTIEYRDRDPRMARAVVQTTLDLFLEAAAGTDRQQMEGARQFLAQQVAAYEAQLREAERRRADFRARYVDVLPSDSLGGGSRLEAARVRLVGLRGELQDARMRRDLTRQQLEAAPAALPPDPVAGPVFSGGAPSALAEAERELRQLRLRFTDAHPDVVAARAAIAQLRAEGGGGAARGGGGATSGGRVASTQARPNPLHEQLRVRMVDADAAVASLERQVRDGEAELERLDALARSQPELQAQSLNLDRDYAVLRKNYEELLERRESIEIADAARVSSDRVRLEVVDAPTVPAVPVGPNRLLLSSGVLVAGLGAGAALAVLLVMLDRTFYTVQDLRALGLPVLGALSAPPARRRPLAALAFVGAGGLLLVAYGTVLAGGPAALAARMPDLLARFTA